MRLLIKFLSVCVLSFCFTSARADVFDLLNALGKEIDKQTQQPSSAPAFSPSFDCAKVSTGPERLICSNRELAEADVKMSQAYKAALSASADKAALKDAQRSWNRTIRDACADVTCMLDAYNTRIAQLDNATQQPANDSSTEQGEPKNDAALVPQSSPPPASTEAQDNRATQTVIAEGIGKDPQDAAQNAAQNALTNVVGQFIDANTLLEKRTTIQDGIRSETKSINKDIRDYSQGSIQSFEIVSTDNANALFRVTAKVTVRIEDFRAYIKKLAQGETNIGGGLFAQMATQSKQAENLAALLKGMLEPIIQGRVLEFKVSQLQPASQLSPNQKFPEEGNDFFFFKERHDVNSIVFFTVDVSLNHDFEQNLTVKLSSTAVKKLRVAGHEKFSYSRDDSFRMFINEVYQLGGVGLLKQTINPQMYDGFVFKITPTEVSAALPWYDDCYGSILRKEIQLPALEISLVGDNARVLQMETSTSNTTSTSKIGNNNMFVSDTTKYPGASSSSEPMAPWIPISCYTGGGGYSAPSILNRKSFVVFLAVKPEALRLAQKIIVKLVQ